MILPAREILVSTWTSEDVGVDVDADIFDIDRG